MSNKQLTTRIILRNDESTNWTNQELLKGEIGIEFDANGKAKMKIGNGSSWDNTDYFGITDDVFEELRKQLNAVEEAYIARCEAIETDIEALENADKVLQEALANLYTKTEINNKIDTLTTAISEETSRAAAAEEALQGAIDALYTSEQVDEKIKEEADRAKAAEGELAGNIADLILNLAEKANSADVYTKEEVETYVTSEMQSAGHLKREIVATLPEGEEIDVDTIYMMAKEGTEGQNAYVEYMYIHHAWEVIGNTTVDLTPYAKTEDVNTAIQEVSDEVATKADATAVNEALATKVDNTTYNEAITNITEDITNITNLIGSTEGGEGDSLLNRIAAIETGKADKATTLAGYGITDAYTKGETYTRAEIAELIADITGGESAADVLAALNTYIGTNDQAVAALQAADTNFETRVSALEAVGAQANVLEAINFNGQDIAIVDKKATFSYTYDLPVAMAEALGGVKSSNAENKISVDTEGAMEVNSLNVNKLIQTEGDILILNGGSATL